jgi:ABC-type uncharacterized transport system auxiliary subunit
MSRRHALPAVFLLGTLAAGGCFGRRPPQIHYYTIALGTEGVRLPVTVRVGSFGAAPPYRTTRIALRRSRYRLDYYDFNRWAANPQSLLAASVQRYFDRIATPGSTRRIDVAGRIDRLEAVVRGGGLRAVVALTFDAQGPDGPLLQRSYVEKLLVDGDEPEDVVAALSEAFDRILARFAADLLGTLS